MRNEIDVRRYLSETIDARRGISRFAPARGPYQLVISALKWSLGEGKKDNAFPGYGHPRGEYAIRKRIRDCIDRRDNSRFNSNHWQMIISTLEWRVGDSDTKPGV